MPTAGGTSIFEGFSQPGVHAITYKDDFYNAASDVRDELLRYPGWIEMRQGGSDGGPVINPARQNGITTGHLRESDRERLPHCLKFRDFLAQNFGALCPLVDVNPADARDVEINAMAYGAGSWLSPHTDSLEYAHADNRLIAWMLYLTAPEDGEWPVEKGGAVRVWKPGGAEERIRPRFNRFAMFRVHNNSFHEIEKIMSEPEWPNCRMALSGWIQGPQVQSFGRKTRMYLQSSSAGERQQPLETAMQGSLALYRLLEKQKNYCGCDAARTSERIADLEEDDRARKDAPEGTSFLRRVAGPAGYIIVVDEAGDTVHFGTTEGYYQKFRPRST